MKVCVALLVFVAAVSAQQPKAKNPILDLDDNTLFPILMPGSGKFFIRFYTSLCEVCKAFTKEWHKVGEAISDDSKKIQVVDFDCNKNRKSCEELWVEQYPTFMWLDEGEIEHELDDEMTKEECIDFANKQLAKNTRKRRDVEEKFLGDITQIDAESFESTISSGVNIILFGMAWCPHCQSELKVMTQVQSMNKLENVKFSLINCKIMSNVNLCFDELSNGVPTVNIYLDGKRTVKDFKANSPNQYYTMIKAHVDGVDELAKWKKAAKIKDDESEN